MLSIRFAEAAGEDDGRTGLVPACRHAKLEGLLEAIFIGEVKPLVKPSDYMSTER